MLVPKHKVEAVCDKGGMRFALAMVHFNKEKSRLEASNGKVLAVVPVDPETTQEDQDKSFITPKQLATARKNGRHVPSCATLKVNGKVEYYDGATEPLDKSADGLSFPDMDAVTPYPKEGGRVKLVINPELLYSLWEAITEDRDRTVGIELSIKVEDDLTVKSAIYAKGTDGAYGVIMPMTGTGR